MSGRLKFLQASDLHLDQTMTGIADVPDHLVEPFLDARLHAFDRVVESAIEERVDAMLLAGHVAHVPTADPRTLDRIATSFEILQEAGISVFWRDTKEDRADQWPAAVTLPPNVAILPADRIESQLLRRGDHVLATIVGWPSGADGRLEAGGSIRGSARVTIAVAHSEPGPKDVPLAGFDYWACGGPHQRDEVKVAGGRVGFSGSPQGQSPWERGPHGCLIVELDSRGRCETRFVATDVLRWAQETLELSPDVDQGGLLQLLRQRARAVLEQSAGRPTLVQWYLADGDQTHDTHSDQLAARLRQGGADVQLLNSLRAEFGMGTPSVWSLQLTAEPPSRLPRGWYEEDTILGDLLRIVQQYQSDATLPLGLESNGRPPELPDEFQHLVPISRGAARERLLRQVAALGVDLLRGDRVLSDEAET